jgi:sigma-E factor negative regulatory protein RseC
MLESPAVVVGTERGAAFVEADFGGGCGSGMCATGGCGSAVLARIFTQNPRRPLRVRNPIDAGVGERVIVGIAEGVLLRTTLVAYLLPLVMLVTGAAAARAIASSNGDAVAAAGGLGGLVLGWVLARALSHRRTKRELEPVILRRARQV